MQIINDDEKEVYNGDIGTAITLDEDRLLAIGENERQVVYGFGELDSVVLVYAMIIHKAQGSEYLVVLVVPTRSIPPCLRGDRSTPVSPAASAFSCRHRSEEVAVDRC